MEALIEAAPVRDQEVEACDLRGADEDLLREITASGVARRSSWRRSGARLRPARARLAFAIGAVAVAVAAVTLIGIGSRGGQESAYAAEEIAVAKANPRLLVRAPGWRVKSADQFSTDFGQVDFTNGKRELEMWWAPASEYEDFVSDRKHGGVPTFHIDVLGQRALTVHAGYGINSPDYETLIPPTGDVFVAVRGTMADREQYVSVVRSLEPTGVEGWLDAMPPSVVEPGERSAALDRLLEGLPLAPTFDRSVLESDMAVADPTNLAANVAYYVACGWLDAWVVATKSGDAAAAKEVKAALATTRDWPVFREARGVNIIHRFADAVARGEEFQRSSYDQMVNCVEYR
jgi:hypothetical protein